MKFNDHELSLFASARIGKADKEGCLWMREVEGKIRKKQSYVQRWFILTGNLLFYCKSETPESSIAGVIILERCKMDVDNESGNKYTFKLLFEESDVIYFFMANFAKDQDEWIKLLSMAGYEHLRTAFSDLRGQLIHLTGQDPLKQDHPLGALPIKSMSSIPASAPVYDGEPAFELSLACSSLVGNISNGVPSPLIVTSCMTPPQDYWIRYAQTEVVERDCDPRFFTTVVFYVGSVSMATRLKFEVFDVYDQKDHKMTAIGQAQCQVMELLMSVEQVLRLDVIYDGATCGYLIARAWRAKESDHAAVAAGSPSSKLGAVGSSSMAHSRGSSPQPSSVPIRGDEVAGLPIMEDASTPFSFRNPMDNIVIRTYQFPLSCPGDKHMKVTEVMGEGKFSFSIPMQLLELYVEEENELLFQYSTLDGLCQDWEISRQDVMLEHSRLVQYYREMKSGLQAQVEAGATFKKSTKKAAEDLDFVPVNLHVQQMKVNSELTESKDKVVYTTVTVGCPTAYRLKYKGGGLLKMQFLPSIMLSVGSYGNSMENKGFRLKALLARVDKYMSSLQSDVQHLLDTLRVLERVQMTSEVGVASGNVTAGLAMLMDRVKQLTAHCNVILVNDSLRDWGVALDSQTSVLDTNADMMCHRIEESLQKVRTEVEPFMSQLVLVEDQGMEYVKMVLPHTTRFLQTLKEVVGTFKKAIIFMLMKESHQLLMEKVPIGVKSYKHRRDIVFSHTVTTIVTSFFFKLLQSMTNSMFLEQLMEVGFLVHWESLLSTIGDEAGMLDDFMTAIYDANNMHFQMVLAESVNDTPRIRGSRYKVTVQVPLQKALFRVLPTRLQEAQEIVVFVVLFTQGINEQQTIADKIVGNSSQQDNINSRSMQQLTGYCGKYKEKFGQTSAKMQLRTTKMTQLLEQLRTQVHTRKYKNVDILSLSQELCRLLDCGRVTSCKSAKDRTAMSVTLEQAHILLQEMQMESSAFHHALDSMRSQGTRLRNAEKNVGVPLYAFNALQVYTLPPLYRPPDGTYKKLQT